jgi:hypothetical protein
MHARFIRPDASAQAATLPGGPGTLQVTCGLTGCLTIVRSRLPSGPAAQAVAALRAGSQVRRYFAAGLTLLAGCDAKGQVRQVARDYGQIIAATAGRLRQRAPGGTCGRQAGGAPGPEVR